MKVKEGKIGKDGNTYYCKDGLMSYNKNYQIMISMGGRGIGKSTEFQRFLLSDFIKNKNKFAIVKPREADLREFAPDYWDDKWMEKWFPEYELMYRSYKYFIRKKKENQSDKEGWRLCGYAFQFASTKKKSTVRGQDVVNVMFEEFTNQEGRYLGNAKDKNVKEPSLFISLLQTLGRGGEEGNTRKMRIFMISNLYHLNNPYFVYFGILDMITTNPNSIYQRFYTYDKGDMHYVLEFPQLKPVNKLLAANQNDEGIVFQDFRNELKLTTDKPKKVIMQLTLDCNYVINVAKYNDSLLFYKAKKLMNDDINMAIYSCSEYFRRNVMNIQSFKGTPVYKVVKDLFQKNEVYYDKMETFIYLTNILSY